MKTGGAGDDSRFLRDLVGAAAGDVPPRGAKTRALARLGLPAASAGWPGRVAGAVLIAALAVVLAAGLRSASPGPEIGSPALSSWSTTPECASGVELPAAPCAEGASPALAAGSSSGATAPGSSGG